MKWVDIEEVDPKLKYKGVQEFVQRSATLRK